MNSFLPRSNAEIAAAFGELAARLALIESSPYRYMAYRRASSTLRTLPDSVAALAREGRLREIDGVGDAIADKIDALLATGTFPALERARAAVPDGLLELTRVPGVGAKTAQTIWNELQAETWNHVVEAAASGALAQVPGVGAKTIASILAHIETEAADSAIRADGDGTPTLLRDQVEQLTEAVRVLLEEGAPQTITTVLPAGAHARGAETSSRVDVVALCAPQLPDARTTVIDLLEAAGWTMGEELEDAEGQWHALTATAPNDVVVRVYLVPEAAPGLGYLEAVGPSSHVAQVRAALHGAELEGTDEATPDAPVYAAAGLDYVEPELRDRPLDEQQVDGLVTLEDLQAELHCHTTWSDGRSSIADMAQAAIAQGDTYMAIADHSAPYAMVGGLDASRLAEQEQEIDAVNAELRGAFTVLRGSEVEVLGDGSLGLDDDTLEKLEWVTASIHMSQWQDAETINARIERVLHNPYVDCIGHPTSRLLLQRKPTAIDTARLFELAAATGTVLEINASPRRLDLDSGLAREALAAGVRLAINSDAHGPNTLGVRRHGVAVARRAGAARHQVVNCLPWPELRDSRKRHR